MPFPDRDLGEKVVFQEAHSHAFAEDLCGRRKPVSYYSYTQAAFALI